MIHGTSILIAAAGLAGATFGACAAPDSSGPSHPLADASAPSATVVTVSNVTTGGAFDLDGFELSIDGKRTVPFDLNDTVTLRDLADGSHSVVLTGIASNCSAVDGGSKNVSVAQGSPAQLRFEVTCTPPAVLASIRIVFARGVDVGGAYGRSSLVAMNGDGSARIQLTSGAFNDYGPDVSPDGRKILFMRDDPTDRALAPGIFLLTTDGSEVPLIEGGYDPDWSPDGSRFAFSVAGNHWGGPIMVARSDGDGVTRLTGQDPDLEEAWPAWSPDGSRLAFMRVDLGPPTGGGPRGGIWLMKPDGSGATQLAGPETYGPVWSPDGRIGFTDGGIDRFTLMNSDGSGVEILHSPQVRFSAVDDWSTDGRFLLFSRPAVEPARGRRDVYLFELATGATVRLTADGGYNRGAVFWDRAPEERATSPQ